MELQRAQILLKKSQHELLTEIARQENRSLSEIVRELLEQALLARQRRQMSLAARELQAEYRTNPDLSEFNALDSEDFFFEADDEKG
jgi:Arc/MetJ-type ribon-helix-helix transcriptional regulator